MSASETPKSRLETSSFPPVSTPAPAPKPLSNRSCCHFSGSCFGCNETGGAGRFLPPPRAITGRFRTGPPPARPPLMMSSRDMSILSAMMAAPLPPALPAAVTWRRTQKSLTRSRGCQGHFLPLLPLSTAWRPAKAPLCMHSLSPSGSRTLSPCPPVLSCTTSAPHTSPCPSLCKDSP
uniref:Uncharacterized protein n=1 Tax=Junco hyemalis TaxID=40217 RepID=A0A8C5NMP6_JUNHY